MRKFTLPLALHCGSAPATPAEFGIVYQGRFLTSPPKGALPDEDASALSALNQALADAGQAACLAGLAALAAPSGAAAQASPETVSTASVHCQNGLALALRDALLASGNKVQVLRGIRH